MRMDFVIVVDPSGDLPWHGRRIRQGGYARVIALEGLHEGFGHSVGLGALHRREARDEVQGGGKVARFLGGIWASIVGQLLDRVWRSYGAEALLDGFEHHVTYVRAADANPAHGGPGDDLPVEGVDDEGHANDLAVPAGELQAIGAPAQV